MIPADSQMSCFNNIIMENNIMKNIDRKINSTVEKQWFTVVEVAAYLGLTEPAVRARLQRGEIPYEKLGKKRVLIKKDVLESLVGGQNDV